MIDYMTCILFEILNFLYQRLKEAKNRKSFHQAKNKNLISNFGSVNSLKKCMILRVHQLKIFLLKICQILSSILIFSGQSYHQLSFWRALDFQRFNFHMLKVSFWTLKKSFKNSKMIFEKKKINKILEKKNLRKDSTDLEVFPLFWRATIR